MSYSEENRPGWDDLMKSEISMILFYILSDKWNKQ